MYKGQVALDNIRPFQTYYKVYKFDNQEGWIEELFVTTKPYNYIGETDYWADATIKKQDGNTYQSKISLMDCGVQPNTYNQHLTFVTLADAEAYLNL